MVTWNCCLLDDIIAPLCVSLLQQVIKSKCCGPLTQHPDASSGGVRRHHWIIFPTLMSRRCRLTADCFICWMDGAETLPASTPLMSHAFYVLYVLSEVILLVVGFIHVACAETFHRGPKLSQRFSQTTVARGAGARVFLNWLIKKGIGTEFKYTWTSGSAFMSSLKLLVY